jgi:hypothetical protein
VPDLGDQIQQAVTDGVQSASVDGRTAAIIPVPDQIEADRYLAGKAAVAGTNAAGGPRSLWGRLRAGRAVFGGHT